MASIVKNLNGKTILEDGKTIQDWKGKAEFDPTSADNEQPIQLIVVDDNDGANFCTACGSRDIYCVNEGGICLPARLPRLRPRYRLPHPPGHRRSQAGKGREDRRVGQAGRQKRKTGRGDGTGNGPPPRPSYRPSETREREDNAPSIVKHAEAIAWDDTHGDTAGDIESNTH